MPAGEIIVEFLGGFFRLVLYLFFDVFVEVVIRKWGYAICRLFKKDVNPEGVLVILVSLLSLAFLGVLLFVFFGAFT